VGMLVSDPTEIVWAREREREAEQEGAGLHGSELPSDRL